jgi:hypothetical protein
VVSIAVHETPGQVAIISRDQDAIEIMVTNQSRTSGLDDPVQLAQEAFPVGYALDDILANDHVETSESEWQSRLKR